MVNRIQVLKTLLYFDIFHFPPQKEEIWQFLEFKEDKSIFLERLDKLGIPKYKNHYYFKNRQNVDLRISSEKINNMKLKKAFKVIKKLSFIPTIKFIGISGSLAMRNSSKEDDIDLFIITQTKLTWFTRLICVVILISLGVYRRSKEREVSNKICLNYLISENALGFSKSSHTLYLAHEITQMLPVLNVDNTYQKFITVNKWIYNFLPNASERVSSYEIRYVENVSFLRRVIIQILQISRIETVARFIQWQYMKRKITREKVSSSVLAFHPINYEKQILDEYKHKIKQLK